MITRSYSELRRLDTFTERFEYLRLKGVVAERTFGYERWINQEFYRSAEWKRIRNHVIARDNGCDLGVLGHETNKSFIVHHMNPMSVEDIQHSNMDILDPEFLISATLDTHNAIHYGSEPTIGIFYQERQPNDTTPWRRGGA